MDEMMIDEETIRKEFEEWAAKESYCLRWLEDTRMYDYANTQEVWNAWIEAARRCSLEYEKRLALMISAYSDLNRERANADRKAREECCRIIEGKVRWIDGLPAIMAIRATIKE